MNGAGTGLAVGGNGYFNPNNLTYPDSADSTDGGVLPNMNGRHVGTLAATAHQRCVPPDVERALQPSTIYTFSVALGVRTNAAVFGGYRLDFLANGVPLGTGVMGDLATLNALAGGVRRGLLPSSPASLPAPSSSRQPATRHPITKPGGLALSRLRQCPGVQPVDPLRQWQLPHWDSLTDPTSLPGADPDADGLPNLIESQLAGMDPRLPNALPQPVATQHNGEDYLQVQFLKKPVGRGPGAVGLLMSYDLSNWFIPPTPRMAT